MEVLWCTLFEGKIIENCWEGVLHPLIKGMIMGLSKEYISIGMRPFG